MTTAYEVPLSAEAQQFSIAMAGKDYWLALRWNAQAPAWVLDISDSQRLPIVLGIPLVTGADLLEQYGYLDFGGKLFVQTDHDTDAVPDYASLGGTGHLYFVVE